MGAPGSGKGTQAGFIADKVNVSRIGTQSAENQTIQNWPGGAW